MYKKILVALDGSALAEQVLPYVRFLAVGLKAPVVLVRAYGIPNADWSDIVEDDEFTFTPMEIVSDKEGRMSGRTYLDQLVERQKEICEDYLDKVAKDMVASGAQVSVSVQDGPAAEVILFEAKKDPLTLIVIGTHGRSGIARWALGSVADKVLHACSSPVLLVHAQKDQEAAQKATVKNIILPLDGSPLAEQALATASAVARSLDARVNVIQAIPPLAGYYGDYMGYEVGRYPEIMDEAASEAKKYLDKTVGWLKGAGVAEVEPRVMHVDPSNGIIDLAHQLPDSLIVMTSHGRSGLGRFVLGSVADKVVRHAGRPVLLVNAREEKAPAKG